MAVATLKPKRKAGLGRRERQRRYNAAAAATEREIGPLPKVRNPKRKAAAKASLRVFLETYLARRFPLAWSSFHRDLISVLETCILRGGQHAYALPRGSGKTSIAL